MVGHLHKATVSDGGRSHNAQAVVVGAAISAEAFARGLIDHGGMVPTDGKYQEQQRSAAPSESSTNAIAGLSRRASWPTGENGNPALQPH